jgi:thiol peroxidase
MTDDRNENPPRQGSLVISGPQLQVGDRAPDFTVLNDRFEPIGLNDANGAPVVLVAVMSVDVPVCETVIRRFDDEAKRLPGSIEVWVVSGDTPFTQKRWCEIARVGRVKVLSDFRERSFGSHYGILIAEGALRNVSTRAAFVVGRDGKIKHAEYLTDPRGEPKYDDVLQVVRTSA